LKISFIIKALNEAKNIRVCIESILKEIEQIDAEVILVDSCSEDGTVEIASEYPISIVQFADCSDRSCGAAVQLGFQIARGDYIYLIDGDMELCPGFLKKALFYMNERKDAAGVSGLIVDRDLSSSIDRRRYKLYGSMTAPFCVKSLGGGGLYRKEAISSVGYFGHKCLNACEELELGIRLISSGWKLYRLPEVSVYHTGHQIPTHLLLIRYYKNRRFKSIGLLIKASFGKKWFWDVLLENKYLFFPFALSLISVGAFFLAGPVAAAWSWMFFFFILFVLLTIRKSSMTEAIESLATWHVILLQALLGLFSSCKSPEEPILYKVIK